MDFEGNLFKIARLGFKSVDLIDSLENPAHMSLCMKHCGIAETTNRFGKTDAKIE